MKKTQRKATYQINQTKFQVIYADITSLKTEVIVSSDDNYLTMGGGVSYSILKVASGEILKDIKRNLPLKLGDVAVTPSGNLKTAKYIFHGITIDYDKWKFIDEEILVSIVKKSLALAENLGLESIAFPALGTGVAGFPFQLAAQLMTNTISEYVRKGSKLKEIVLCLYAYGHVKQNDLNQFYEKAVGLASIVNQSYRLDILLSEVKEILVNTNRKELIQDVDLLLSKIEKSNNKIANHRTDNEVFEEGLKSPVNDLAEELNEFNNRQDIEFDDKKLELKLLRTKMSGLYTTLNVKQAILNRHEIEEAKYGGQMIPPRLSFAIKDLKDEMREIEENIKNIKMRQAELME